MASSETSSPMDASTPASPPSSEPKTTSVAILIGAPGSNGASHNTIPVVVWANQERARDSPEDAWRHTLQYYEFLDDVSRWTHLDQLLVRHNPRSLHVGCSESLSSSPKKSTSDSTNAKTKRVERLLESLQVFLDERDTGTMNTNDSSDSAATEEMACHVHTHVAVDATKVESAMSQLLLQDPDVQLAYRGNVQLCRGLLQQGLSLWLQAEDLYPPSTTLSSSTTGWPNSLKIQQGVLSSHLVMDRTAAQCIHLLPPPNDGAATVVGGHAHNNSLWGVLSKPCRTQMGKTKLQVWLRQPLLELSAILHRQDAVTDLLGLGKDCLGEALQAFSSSDLPKLANTLGQYNQPSEGDDQDIDSSMANINTKKPLQALYQLYLLASSHLPQLQEAIANIETTSDLLKESQDQVLRLVAELDRCQGLVEAVLDLDQAPRDYLVRPTFSENLQELHQELQTVQQQVEEELEQMQDIWASQCGDAGGKNGQVRLEQLQDESSWQFRLPNANDIKALQTIDGCSKLQVHRVLKNGVYFSTLTLRQLSTKYQDLMSSYSRHSRKVVFDAMAVACSYQTVVERAAEVVSTLDVVCAMAHVAAYSPHGYCKPTLTDSEEAGAGITLKAARHPCVELQEDMEFIPNDVSMVFGESNFLLVTGPNMGGKSTYIRALGAIVCLAQIGSYVPAQAATINICHAILARVGAGDLQERGISTFMAEMLEASSILRTATKRSLIIIDELGRGTSTFDGYGLAKAISEYLMDRVGCMTVFATHFHELTHLSKVKNCHVTAQKGTQGLTFLYEVRPGPCLESFGIQVAEMANVPSCVIEDAKRKAADLEDFGATASHSENGKRKKKNDAKVFVQRFCKLDLPSILDEGTMSVDEKRTKLLELLA